MTSASRDNDQTRAVISIAAFRNNMQVVRACVGDSVKIMAVVKANAYGHGVERIATDAINQGAEYLGVARVGEGIEMREAGIHSKTLVFEIVPRGLEESALRHDLELTIVGMDSADRIDRFAAKLGVKAKVQAKIDTGMGRLGIDFREAAKVIGAAVRLPHLELVGIYSHFATSDSPDATFAREQLSRFNKVLDELDREKIPVGVKHIANSGAILTFPESHLDMVRPGIMLYGYLPRRDMNVNRTLTPVLSLLSHVAFVKTVDANTSISYGRRFVATRTTTIGTIPIGYADGFVRSLYGKASVIVRGKKFPVVGTICMDHVMIDLGSKSDVREGDEVTIIGASGRESISSWDLADQLGTIPYEITSLISQRIPRILTEENS